MKVGDNVWVSVSRDRERSGKIEEIDLTSYLPYLVSLDGLMAHGSTWYSDLDVRPVSKPQPKPKFKPQAATKHDQEKNRLELIPASGIEAAGRAFTYGANKYKEHGDHNWAKGFKWDRIIGSTLRHINAFRSGQDIDEESGLSHIDHAVASIMMLAAHIEEGLGEDNRRKVKAK